MIQFTDEQRMISDSVARFLADAYAFDKRQKIVGSEAGFDKAHWQTFAELGLLGARFPEELDGLGGSLIESAIICEQFGRHLVMSPLFGSSILAGSALLLCASREQQQQFIPPICQGELIATAALAEPLQPNAPLPMTTRATKTSSGYRLEGQKTMVPYIASAELIVVSAVVDEVLALFAVPSTAKGISTTPYRTYDGGRAGDVEFRSVNLSASDRLDNVDDVAQALNTLNNHACAMLCVEASGAMWSIHDQTLEYMKTREQFGQTISTFQALQHRIVDVYVKCQLVQSIAWDAVSAVVYGGAHVAQRISAAKAEVGEYGRDVGKEGVHLHGGIGMTDDVPVGHYLKRLTAIDMLYGSSRDHLNRFSALNGFSN